MSSWRPQNMPLSLSHGNVNGLKARCEIIDVGGLKCVCFLHKLIQTVKSYLCPRDREQQGLCS